LIKIMTTDFSEFEKLYEELGQGSDRAVAILAATLLDEFLSRLLRSYLIQDKQVVNSLIEGDSSFSRSSIDDPRALYIGTAVLLTFKLQNRNATQQHREIYQDSTTV